MKFSTIFLFLEFLSFFSNFRLFLHFKSLWRYLWEDCNLFRAIFYLPSWRCQRNLFKYFWNMIQYSSIIQIKSRFNIVSDFLINICIWYLPFTKVFRRSPISGIRYWIMCLRLFDAPTDSPSLLFCAFKQTPTWDISLISAQGCWSHIFI